MVTIELQGRITEEGQLEVELPAGLPAGDVKVHLQMAANGQNVVDNNIEAETLSEERPLTQEEWDELFKNPTPKTGAEIVAMLRSGELDTSEWTHITDSVAWVEEIRRRAWGRE